ncbi:MAG: AMP-binding protein [Actinomycetes bacterium]
MNLASMLLRSTGADPDAPALIDVDRVVTFAELEALAASTAGALAGIGVRPGDRVAIASGNDLAFVTTYLGALWAGAIAVPLNPQEPTTVVAEEIRRVEAGVLVCGPTGSAHLGVPGAVAHDALAPGEAMAVEVERDDDEVAVLLYTSGTAGMPKAAMLTHGNLAANIGQVLGDPGLALTNRDRTLGVLPFFHVFGLNVVLGVALTAGASVVLVEPFDPARAVAAVRDHGVTVVAAVPLMYDLFTAVADAPADAFTGVRLAVSGAAALDPDRARAFTDRFGIDIHEGYGLTEAAPIVTSTAAGGAPRHGSIGPSVPGVEVRLVDAHGADVVAGDPGEIWVRGPNVFAGYWEDPEATARVITADGWLRTGDVAVADADGYLSLVDRLKDLIIVSGFNVYPVEVEEALRTHDAVADAAVAAIPDPRTGEAVGAWVVARPGMTVDADALRAHVGTRLARYKVPARVTVVDAVPRSPAGKLLRRALTESG